MVAGAQSSRTFQASMKKSLRPLVDISKYSYNQVYPVAGQTADGSKNIKLQNKDDLGILELLIAAGAIAGVLIYASKKIDGDLLGFIK